MRQMDPSPTQWTWVWVSSGSWDGQGSLACCSPWVTKSWTRLSDWTTTAWTSKCREYLSAQGPTAVHTHRSRTRLCFPHPVSWHTYCIWILQGNDEASACKTAQEFQKQDFLFCISSLWEWQLAIWEGTRGFPCGSAGRESACNAGDLGSIPVLGRSPRERKGYPLQYSGLENSLDCTVHGVEKSRTLLSNFHFTSLQRGCEGGKESKRKGKTKLNMSDIPLPLGRISMLCYVGVLSHVWLFVTPWTTACQVPLSMGFSRQEYWSGFSFPPPGDLPNTGIEAESPEWSLYHCITWEAHGRTLPYTKDIHGYSLQNKSCRLRVIPILFQCYIHTPTEKSTFLPKL